MSQVAMNLGEYFTSIYMVKSYLCEWYSHLMLQRDVLCSSTNKAWPDDTEPVSNNMYEIQMHGSNLLTH